jgi:predicted dehydrogenase
MKLFWQGSWMDTPGYDVPDAAILINVDMAVPLLRLEHASGRVTRRPYRKVATFLWTDGPRSTLRKVRTKRAEPSFTGDFRTVLILGRMIPSQKSIVAIGCRVPPAAQQMPVHRSLVREVSGQLSSRDLLQVAHLLATRHEALARMSRQSYLYSAMEPPTELTNLLDEAISQCEPGIAESSTVLPSPIRPPKGPNEAADTTVRLNQPKQSGIPVALLGAGDYARTEIIPALRAAGLSLHSVANREPQIAAMVAHEHGFVVAATASERAIAELPRPGLVVIATGHDSHARLANVAIRAGHRAFVEKPPAVTPDDVSQLIDAMMACPGAIEIGFNRRYHPLILRARTALQQEQGPASITCTIKEIQLNPDHWYFWPNQGTRITGNLCHWIDLAVFLLDSGSVPVSLTLSPRVSDSAQAIDEERVLTVTFEDGSLLTILATSRGDDIRGVQEQIEIRKGRTTITIDDLWKMRVRRGGVDHHSRTLFRHKAHADMYRTALRRFLRSEPAAYPADDMVVVSAIQIAASELARSGDLRGEIPSWLEPSLQRLS